MRLRRWSGAPEQEDSAPPTALTRPSPRAHFEHGLRAAYGREHDCLDGRLSQEADGRLARQLAVRGSLDLVDQRDDARPVGHVLAAARGMSEEPRDDPGRDLDAEGRAAERADELGTVDVFDIQRLSEDVGADDRNDQGRLDRKSVV